MSWRKVSRVEQIIRVVGEVWWRRMKLIKSKDDRLGDIAIGVKDGDGMIEVLFMTFFLA